MAATAPAPTNGTSKPAEQPPAPAAVSASPRRSLTAEQQTQAHILFTLVEMCSSPSDVPETLRLLAEQHEEQRPALLAVARALEVLCPRKGKAPAKRGGKKGAK